LAVETTPPDEYGLINVTVDVAEESIQRRAVLYDKDGDAHFDTISAFIKSLRGSDPDAALYWMARMVYAGEDPRFIFRRMLIFAGEDIGLADPNALRVVTAAAQAFDYVGLPEGRFHLATACLYLATAPKSNSALAFFDALTAVEREREAEVPDHLRDSSRDAADFGHGAGYLYPHAYRDHWVAQQYLPEGLQGRLFYRPTNQGYEATIRDQVARRREEQLTAMLESELSIEGLLEKATQGAPTHNRWLQRTLGNVGQQLGQLRDKVFALARVERHDLVLDLNAGTGLLTWEAVRRASAGGVWALATDEQTAEALKQQNKNLGQLERPVILTGAVTDLPQLIAIALAGQDSGLSYDLIIGRNVLTHLVDKAAAVQVIHDLLKRDGRVVLAEVVPKCTQRLSRLVDLSSLSPDLAGRVIAAEERIYSNTTDPMVNWDEHDLLQIFQEAGFSQAETIAETSASEQRIGPNQIERWFSLTPTAGRPTFAQHLLSAGSDRDIAVSELTEVKKIFQSQLAEKVVPWHSTVVYLVARP
jgi:putative ATPase